MNIGLYFFFCSMSMWTGALHFKSFIFHEIIMMWGNSNTDILNLLEILLLSLKNECNNMSLVFVALSLPGGATNLY
jgi:hypothetical protein